MPAPKRPATKQAVAAKSPVARKPLVAKKETAGRSSPARPFEDPLLELFGRAVAATQERRWRDAAGLFRRLLNDTGDDPGLGGSARQYLALCEQRLGEGRAAKSGKDGHAGSARRNEEPDEDPYLQAVFEKNRGEFATALALCRRGGRHRRDERMAYLAASILALEGELAESAELLALAVDQNPKNRVQAFHDSDFAEVLGKAEFAFVLDPA
jgi:hypothetical protein